jgi:hypothetical protein
MRLFAFAAALLNGHALWSVAASNLRISATPAVKAASHGDSDLLKLQTIDHALQGLAKQAHSPSGTKELLELIHKSESDLKSVTSNDARAKVMKKVNSAMAAFQADLVKRQLELKKAAAADEEKKLESLKPIATRLQDRLDKLNAAEKDLKARAKAREDSEANMQHTKLSHKQSKEDLKTQKLLKYFAKKNKREVQKKLASWAVERKALTEAIRRAKAGDAEGTRAAMQSVIHAEKGDQDFLH